MVLLEAASLGVPIICSDIPENRAVIQDNTLYFRSGDIQDLANQIQWAFDHFPNIEEVARRASETLIQTLSWDNIALQYEQVYQHCLMGDVSKLSFYS